MAEKKLDATLQVVDKQAQTPLSGRVGGVFHLFEHQYDDLHFWYGVAEASIPMTAFTRHPPATAWIKRVNVYLEDGRAGQCHVLRVQAQGGPGVDSDYMRVQLVGASALQQLNESDPHFTPHFGR